MKNKNILTSRIIYRKETIDKLQSKINLLGYKKKYDALKFMNIRIFTSAFIFFMVLYLFDWGYLLAPIITFAYYFYLPKLMIDKKIEERKRVLDNDAIYFFEVLTLSLESGRNLKTALFITSDNINSELSSEFKKTLDEVNYGKSFEDALDDLKARIPSDTINNIILNIKESNIFGNSIIETLRNQVDYITDKKLLETKAEISKIPLKISVVSVVFFIPLLLLLILSPIIIDYLS